MTDAGEKRVFENMTEPLVVELKTEVADLIGRVAKQAEAPSVIDLPFIPSTTVLFAPALSAAEAYHHATRGTGSRSMQPPARSA